MSMKKNKFGFINIFLLFKLLVIIVFLYLCFQVGRFYFDFYTLKNEARNLLLNAHYLGDENIRQRILSIIDKKGMPIQDKELKVGRSKEKIIVRVKYKEILVLDKYDIYTFDFEIEETRHFR